MRDATRKLQQEMLIDIARLNHRNNSRIDTPEKIRQSETDKANYYTRKWLRVSPETKAQERYVRTVLDVCFAVWQRANEKEESK